MSWFNIVLWAAGRLYGFMTKSYVSKLVIPTALIPEGLYYKYLLNIYSQQ